MTFTIDEWVHEPKERIDYSNKDLGGIWVTQTLSGAKSLVRYMKNKYKISTRLFECEIGKILYQNSYRVKSDKVKITNEVIF